MAKNKRPRDPFAVREANKYAHPVPSREFILQYLQDRGKPASYEQLLTDLHLQSQPEQEGLRRRLRAMMRDGQLVRNRRGHYGLPRRMQLLRGRVVGHKDGFGFVVPEEGGDDLFINPRNMRILFDGDRVLVRVASIDDRGRSEAEIVEILERQKTQIVGRFFCEGGIAFVVPDNKRISQTILVQAGAEQNAQDGQIVVVELISYPSRRSQALGRVIEVLGDHMAPGMEVDIAIRAYDLPYEWPAGVLAETAHLQNTVPESALADRKDVRDWPFVTIDGEDAKDFDDAVYCERNKRGTGWKLWVAIADVSHYVEPGSAVDQEALRRANSVYFPGHVVPMLPEVLSNELCSLQPDVDRLCMVCEMSISAQGKLTRHQFFPAVMRSHARLIYDDVAKLFAEKANPISQKHPDLVEHLLRLYDLYKVLRQQREARGAIDFDTPESKIIFGDDRKIERIVRLARNEAHQLIEECMLMANLAAAKFLLKARIPILYRVHEPPSSTKLAEVKTFLAELGINLPGGGTPEPGDYAKVLQSVVGRSDYDLIQTVLLRSLSRAVYSPENKGHFGLAFPSYTHFTSPIRRYPDLLVHRAIRFLLNREQSGQSLPAQMTEEALELATRDELALLKCEFMLEYVGSDFAAIISAINSSRTNSFAYTAHVMQEVGEHCSHMERRADEATRDAVAWLKCEFMLQHVGSVFKGIISSVTSFGIFVELQDFYVEGLVHITALKNDYYNFDPVKHRLCGERTNQCYRLGDAIEVRVARVDLDEKQIDFELASDEKPRKKSKKKR